ncbi:hypothetical protein PS3A_16310 [Pseudomonas sp. 3A(2025)]
MTLAIVPDAVPVRLRLRSEASTPLTLSLKVTVKLTELLLVGVEPTRTMPLALGAAVSTSTPAVLPTLFSVRFRSLPARSVSGSLRKSRLLTTMPLLSLSPGCTVYWNVSAELPLPET